MKTKEEALKQKEPEIQKQLTDWMKACGLFAPGDQVQVTFTLTNCPPVTVLSNDRGRRVKRWENVSSELSDEDWEIILAAQTSEWCKVLLQQIRKDGNIPFNLSAIGTQLGYRSRLFSDSINVSCFAKHNLHYRIREVTDNAPDTSYVEQIFKVRPLFRKK